MNDTDPPNTVIGIATTYIGFCWGILCWPALEERDRIMLALSSKDDAPDNPHCPSAYAATALGSPPRSG